MIVATYLVTSRRSCPRSSARSTNSLLCIEPDSFATLPCGYFNYQAHIQHKRVGSYVVSMLLAGFYKGTILVVALNYFPAIPPRPNTGSPWNLVDRKGFRGWHLTMTRCLRSHITSTRGSCVPGSWVPDATTLSFPSHLDREARVKQKPFLHYTRKKASEINGRLFTRKNAFLPMTI